MEVLFIGISTSMSAWATFWQWLGNRVVVHAWPIVASVARSVNRQVWEKAPTN